MSWYPEPNLTLREEKYLKLLEYIFLVKNSSGEWVQYKMEPHQREFHSHDVIIQKENAKSSIVIKSRNTSFTTSGCIRNIISVPHYGKQIYPFVRLNMTRAVDLINEVKDIVKHTRMIRLHDGSLYPFDKSKVDFSKSGSIRFPNGAEFRAMPANSQSAEVIRGMRLRGSVGIIDESNFMKDFKDIYIALRDAASGSDSSGANEFQATIGTTRKGLTTKFNIWFESIKKKINSKLLNNIEIFEWPVFNPKNFDIDKSILEQDLDPIVHWHNANNLEEKRLEDKKIFLEEFMAILTNSEDTFYNLDLIMNLVVDDLKIDDVNAKTFFMGIDPAGEGNDFFAISVFEIIGDTHFQRELFYSQKIGDDLDAAFNLICDKIDYYKPLKVRVDANMLGYQLGQKLKKKYGNVVEVLRGVIKIRVRKDFSIGLNEYMHTNLKKLISNKKVRFMSDEIQFKHFSSWDYSFRCEHTKEYGHGDTTVSNGLACLPLHWRSGESGSQVLINHEHKKVVNNKNNNNNIMDRIKMYKKQMQK